MKQNLKNGTAANGYDTVAYFQNQAIEGTANYSSNHNDAKYVFSSAKNKAEFDKNPSKYAPQYGGFCARSMVKGGTTNPSPKSFRIQDGKLYLFTTLLWGLIDSQRSWSKKPDELRKLADAEWIKK